MPTDQLGLEWQGVEQLDIVYRDEHIVAINKPAGLLVHRSPIDRHETRFALQLLRDQLGQRVYPVHRLDKPTSGVLLFALSPEVARQLSEQFADRGVEKEYLAVCRGYCPEQGIIDHPLKDRPDRIVDRDRSQELPVREATTRFQTLAGVEIPYAVDRYPQSRYSLVLLQPETGRKHQLRRHMKHVGHPIIGDAKHGKGVHNRFFQQQYQCSRLLLACTGMRFKHPLGFEDVKLVAPLDAQWHRVLNAFGWSNSVPRPWTAWEDD